MIDLTASSPSKNLDEAIALSSDEDSLSSDEEDDDKEESSPSPKKMKHLPRNQMLPKNVRKNKPIDQWTEAEKARWGADKDEGVLITDTLIEAIEKKEKEVEMNEEDEVQNAGPFNKHMFVEIGASAGWLRKNKDNLTRIHLNEDGTCVPQLAIVRKVDNNIGTLVVEYSDGGGGFQNVTNGLDDDRPFKDVVEVVHDTCASCHKDGTGKFVCFYIFLLL